MLFSPPASTLEAGLRVFLASVWIFHGLYSKVLDRIPRHRLIVARVLGERFSAAAKLIGGLEIAMGLWILSGIQPIVCASAQTVSLVSMNVLEIWLARDLLISPLGMAVLNAGFLALGWWWALAGARG